MLSKISQAQKDKYLYEAPRIVKFIETESRIELTSRDRVERAYLFNGYRDSAWDDEKVLQVNSGSGGYTISWKYLMPLNSTLENDWMVTFMLHVFYHNKNKFTF